MTKLTAHQSSETTKMILMGNNGGGKTGSLCSLAGAGYNLRIVDLDNGADILANILSDPGSMYGKGAIDRVDFETITDKMKNAGGRLIPAKATVWQRVVDLLTKWKTESSDFGPITSWTPKEVLVIDSLTMLTNSALAFNMMLNNRLGQKATWDDIYQTQQMLESLFQMLFDEAVKCNVIIMAHIDYIEEIKGHPPRGYPKTIGNKLSPNVGTYFNSILLAQSSGQGANAKRKIFTNTVGIIELKNSAPNRVKPEYDQATGLAEFFRDVRGESPKATN